MSREVLILQYRSVKAIGGDFRSCLVVVMIYGSFQLKRCHIDQKRRPRPYGLMVLSGFISPERTPVTQVFGKVVGIAHHHPDMCGIALPTCISKIK